MRLDEKGRCCGCKPLPYKRERQRFCCRCNRSYDYDTGEQIANFAWKQTESGEFIKVRD